MGVEKNYGYCCSAPLWFRSVFKMSMMEQGRAIPGGYYVEADVCATVVVFEAIAKSNIIIASPNKHTNLLQVVCTGAEQPNEKLAQMLLRIW